jgi:NADPH:quinone reductase
MKAVALTRYLPIVDPDSLVDVELPIPNPLDNDVLVRVQAISVNPVDTKVRAPKDKVEKEPKVLGWDAAGGVEAVGSAVTRFRVGDEVYYARCQSAQRPRQTRKRECYRQNHACGVVTREVA